MHRGRFAFDAMGFAFLAIGLGTLDLLLESADAQTVIGRLAHGARKGLSCQAQGLARSGSVVFGLYRICPRLIGH